MHGPGAALRSTRYLDASAEDVWATLTDPASLARWLAQAQAFELPPGGRFPLRLGTHDAKPIEDRIRELEPLRVLELDWRLPGEAASIVRFELVPEDPGTKLVLLHRRLDERICLAYARRWETALDRLAGTLAPDHVR